MAIRDIGGEILKCELAIAQMRAAQALADMEGWRQFQETIGKLRSSHLEKLAADPACDVAYERAVIAVLSTIRSTFRADPGTLRSVEERLRGLQEEATRMQDAGLTVFHPSYPPSRQHTKQEFP